MLDPKLFRTELDATLEKLATRGFQIDKSQLLTLEEQRKTLQVKVEYLRNERNVRSKSIGQAKAKGDTEGVEHLLAQVNQVANDLAEKEIALEKVQQALEDILWGVPNFPHKSVPKGRDEEDNVEICRWGNPKKFEFTPKDHVELGERFGLIDFEAGSKLSGARFVVMKGAIARLHRALAQFMLSIHTQEHDYEEVNVPLLVDHHCFYGTGQLPKFSEEIFMLAGDRPMGLISTAEIPVTNLARDSIINEEELPIRYVCHSPCFRSEAGSYGKDTRGMIRNHQFEKVELVQLVKPEDSYKALEALTQHAETILQRLELPYRKIVLCTGDMGFSSAKTYDLEVWLPSQNKYREISSCSNFEAFQARRMKARYRQSDSGKTEYLHTVNGSGLAVGRTLVAILENYQDQHGDIHVPHALIPYCDGMTKVGASESGLS